MNIIKKGILPNITKKFTCEKRSCIFEADRDEYDRDEYDRDEYCECSQNGNNINVEDTIGGRNEFADCIRDSVECVLGNTPTVFTIPENPTNGDVIQAIFPDTEIEGNGSEGAIQSIAVSIGYGTSYFALDWWNAPYKKGDASE